MKNTAFLRRLGNKARIAEQIIKYFPEHETYIELFFGCGGLFFNKKLAKYNYLNDIDSEIFNLFHVVKEQKDAFIEAWQQTPIHSDLWQYWKKNQEPNEIWRAIRFCYLSNLGYMGQSDTMQLSNSYTKQQLLKGLKRIENHIHNCQFMNYDFREVLNKLHWRHPKRELPNMFIYCDPPYLGTENNYKIKSKHGNHDFTEQDFINLLDLCINSNMKFAISEFDNPIVLNQAKERNLNIIYICERQSMKKRNTEILITNYEINHLFN